MRLFVLPIAAAAVAALTLASCGANNLRVEAQSRRAMTLCYDPVFSSRQEADATAARHCARQGLEPGTLSSPQGSQCGFQGVMRRVDYICE